MENDSSANINGESNLASSSENVESLETEEFEKLNLNETRQENGKTENELKEKDTGSSYTEEVEEILSEEILNQNHSAALQLKDEGNEKFGKGDYEVAVKSYTDGLTICPKSFAKTKSILHANRAACYIKQDEKELAIKDCTEALLLDQYYKKARLRRAQMYEATEKLEDALADYKEVLNQDHKCQIAGEAVMRLPVKINERNERLKAEMFDKLKDLGNVCLKPFGLSTDNFKVQQDPNTGGYSINFQK